MIALAAVLLASSAAAIDSYHRANALFQQQQFAEAGKALDQALAADPDYVPALTLRGKFAMGFNRFDIARDAFQHAARIAPDSAYAQFMLGFFYYVDNDFAQAVPPLEAAVRLNKDDTQAPFYLAMSEEGLAHADAALSWYEKTIELETRLDKKPNVDLHTAYGRLLFTLGRYEECAREVARVLELDATSRDGHYEKGRLLLQRDQFAAAAAEGEKALASSGAGTTDRQIHFLLAQAYAKAGEKKLADEHRRLFAASPPQLRR